MTATLSATPAFQSAFPTFPAADIPAVVLLPGWRDASWGNDACPFFIHEASGVGVWVEQAAIPEREAAHRFTAVALWWDGSCWSHGAGGAHDLFDAETIEVLEHRLPEFTMPRAIAHYFALGIGEHLTDGQREAVRERNANPDNRGTCATHDFVDANEIMGEAFEEAMSRPAIGDDGMTDADAALWNEAWTIARNERLTADPNEA